jgi:hypothetical protein
MNGGAAGVFTQGDVLIVPSIVPHWFRAIHQPIG